MRRPALLALALAAAFLAARPAAAQEAPFEATGEVRFLAYGTSGTSAAFDAVRVVGPLVNLTRRDDGTWDGDLLGEPVNLALTKDGLAGPNVNLHISSLNGRIHLEGLFFGRRIRMDLDAKRLEGRFGPCALDLRRKHADYLEGDLGCAPGARNPPQSGRASVKLLGQAAEPEPPLPQLALALLASLPE